MSTEKPIKGKTEVAPPSPRIHFNEFTSLHTSLDDMQKAGFKTICKKEWMRKSEWDEALKSYLGK